MNKYRNRLTGVVIEVPSEIKGGLWELENPSPKTAPVMEAQEIKEPVKKTRKASK